MYVQGNIHAGEVEGKEALLALLRDLAFAGKPNALDSIVLIAVPIYNADGNERFASQAVNRTEQNGPELVGVRANAQSLDLNRDYVKAEAPETRASLAMFNTWDPDVFVDLHTTNGSYHGYALTYSPSLNPAAVFGGVYARDSLLPVLRQRMRMRHGFETFDYGNFLSDERNGVDTTVREGWATYDPRPRFGTNYYGMRGRIGILSEAYSHDPLERRIASTYAFVREILSLVGEREAAIRSLSARADSQPLGWGPSPDSLRTVSDSLAAHDHASDDGSDQGGPRENRRFVDHTARCPARGASHRTVRAGADARLRSVHIDAGSRSSGRLRSCARGYAPLSRFCGCTASASTAPTPRGQRAESRS